MSPGVSPSRPDHSRASRVAPAGSREARKGAVRRRRVLAAGGLAIAVAAVATIILQHGGGRTSVHSPAASVRPKPTRPDSFAVGIRVLKLVDHTRTVELPSGAAPRSLLTYVRYPALGNTSATDIANAPAAQGPFPLIVFGHGFAVTPALYARLLQAWTRAGYVVAAPVFPLENANAPGGPNESDLPNQPGDMRFVISELLALAAARSGPLAGLIDPAAIAVAGQSDGGDTALAVAYDSRFRDPRVKAAIILSGAEMPGLEEFTFARGGPPLLATQGTADTVNPPSATNAFFAAASRPKYLLNLLGAEHLPPYSQQEPQLAIVQRVTIAFLGAYLGGKGGAIATLREEGNVPGVAAIVSAP